jgi:hypothetical protein
VGADGWQHIQEMYPASGPTADVIKRSTDPNHPDYDPNAVSDLDYVATFYDTLTDPAYVAQDPMDNRPHIPLGLKIRQESYSWDDALYDDFIIFKYVLTNIVDSYLEDVYVGLLFDCDILYRNYNWSEGGFDDDISGHIRAYDGNLGDSILIAWSADNDGNPLAGTWYHKSLRSVFGVSLLDFPGTAESSFNWWVSEQYQPSLYDWGPMRQENYRDFGTGGLGTPEGDRNKYYIMSNNETDYDQTFSGIDYTNEGWLPPPAYDLIRRIADGYDTRFLFSFGSFDLMPGDSVDFAFVIALGENFHQNPDDFSDLFDIDNPQLYYESLNFSNLVDNVIAARNKYLSSSGDFNRSGEIDIADVVSIVNFMFMGTQVPYALEFNDYNCDGSFNLTDLIYLINYLFRDGNSPCDPDGNGYDDC